jgi:hypothetical protein
LGTMFVRELIRGGQGGSIRDRREDREPRIPSPIRFTNRGVGSFTRILCVRVLCVCVAASVENKVLVEMPLTSS